MSATATQTTEATRTLRDPQSRLHLLIILVVSCSYEALFTQFGINPLDDSWPIYAIWNMDKGGALFHDVLWVFPPGHLIPAWIGYHLAPPGLVGARIIYAVFAVAVSLGIYVLGRRLMPARFALLAALMTSVAAPDSHLMHLVFGYRYMIFSILGLLAFARYIDTRNRRLLFIAGLWLAGGAFFRLGPQFAAGCGIGVAIMSMHRDPREWLLDWRALGGGVLAVFVPLLVWAAASVGLETLWRELVTRPATMLLLQSLPFPPIEFPEEWNRVDIRKWFVASQFRVIWVLYGGYLAALFIRWLRAFRSREPFGHPLLVAVWLWGLVFFLRSLTRSDEPHLDSVIPPVLLLASHGVYMVVRRVAPLTETGAGKRAWIDRGVILAAVSLWIVLLGVDTYVPHARRGGNVVHAVKGRIEVGQKSQAILTDLIVRRIKLTPPNARILDLTVSPMYHVLADRRGYNAPDIVMPGTFLSPEEEQDFINRVKRNPPALVIWSKKPFDRNPEKAVELTSPKLAAWVKANYTMWGLERKHFLMGRKGTHPPAGW